METLKDLWEGIVVGLFFSSILLGLLVKVDKPDKIVFITHTNIGIYKSKLEAKQLDQDERLKLARAIEQYKRPKFDPPETEAEKEWIKDVIERHESRIGKGYFELSNTGVWTEELGWFDEFASEVKLKDLHIENTERPE